MPTSLASTKTGGVRPRRRGAKDAAAPDQSVSASHDPEVAGSLENKKGKANMNAPVARADKGKGKEKAPPVNMEKQKKAGRATAAKKKQRKEDQDEYGFEDEDHGDDEEDEEEEEEDEEAMFDSDEGGDANDGDGLENAPEVDDAMYVLDVKESLKRGKPFEHVVKNDPSFICRFLTKWMLDLRTESEFLSFMLLLLYLRSHRVTMSEQNMAPKRLSAWKRRS